MLGLAGSHEVSSFPAITLETGLLQNSDMEPLSATNARQEGDKIIVEKSTLPVRTAEAITEGLLRRSLVVARTPAAR